MNKSIIYPILGFIVGVFFCWACEKKTSSQAKANDSIAKETLIPPKEVEANHRDFAEKEGLLYYKNSLFSGYLIEKSRNNQLLSKAGYWQGKQEGKAEKWYPNGQVSEIRFYQDNRKEGTHTAWWENGQKRFEYHFSKEIPIQTHYQWYRSGKLYSLATYDAKGQPDGPQQMWYEDGKIKANLVVKHGRRYGFLGAKGCSKENTTKKKA